MTIKSYDNGLGKQFKYTVEAVLLVSSVAANGGATLGVGIMITMLPAISEASGRNWSDLLVSLLPLSFLIGYIAAFLAFVVTSLLISAYWGKTALPAKKKKGSLVNIQKNGKSTGKSVFVVNDE